MTNILWVCRLCEIALFIRNPALISSILRCTVVSCNTKEKQPSSFISRCVLQLIQVRLLELWQRELEPTLMVSASWTSSKNLNLPHFPLNLYSTHPLLLIPIPHPLSPLPSPPSPSLLLFLFLPHPFLLLILFFLLFLLFFFSSYSPPSYFWSSSCSSSSTCSSSFLSFFSSSSFSFLILFYYLFVFSSSFTSFLPSFTSSLFPSTPFFGGHSTQPKSLETIKFVQCCVGRCN